MVVIRPISDAGYLLSINWRAVGRLGYGKPMPAMADAFRWGRGPPHPGVEAKKGRR
jgi:hypothetical protein